MLELFYPEPNKYAFALQIYAIKSCQNNLVIAHHEAKINGTICIVDRSVWGNVVFAALQCHMGNISVEEWNAYMSIIEHGKKYICDHIIYLDCEPQKAMGRILERSRASEKPIQIEYLNTLEQFYTTEMLLHMKNKTANIVPFDWNSYGEPVTVLDGLVANHTYDMSRVDPGELFQQTRDKRRECIHDLINQQH